MSDAPLIAEFELKDGGPVSVNLASVDYFKPADQGTIIILSDGVQLEVIDSYDAVAETLNPERQAGE